MSVSGDTGRTERAHLTEDDRGRARNAVACANINHGWAIDHAADCDDCLDLLARALAPEPSGVPPETDGTQLVVGWVARATLLEILNAGGCWGGVDRNGEAYLTDGADRIVARVVARLSGAIPRK